MVHGYNTEVERSSVEGVGYQSSTSLVKETKAWRAVSLGISEWGIAAKETRTKHVDAQT